ncbi:MAG: GspH/FimT family pseudopilin [Ghiorsea sp.]|nr:GspH/FimT family pseudopilin [Ghiorsea sp.]
MKSCAKKAQAGFTLLEILLVIVMLAVTAAMVVPSIQISGGSVAEESNRLRLIMHFAADEAQLTGAPIRALLKKDEYSFEIWQQEKKNGEWFTLDDTQFKAYALPQSIQILNIEQAVNYMSSFTLSEGDILKEDILGYILFFPDGTLSAMNIQVGNEEEMRVLEIRPGPSGIRLRKSDEY